MRTIEQQLNSAQEEKLAAHSRENEAVSLPDICVQCGGRCGPTERRICLAELDGDEEYRELGFI